MQLDRRSLYIRKIRYHHSIELDNTGGANKHAVQYIIFSVSMAADGRDLNDYHNHESKISL
jgi:hypothetical protein